MEAQMKIKFIKFSALAAVAILATFAFGAAAFAQGPTGATPNNAYGFGRGYGRGMGMGMWSTQQNIPAATSTTPLTDAERAGLLYMREEEKLAHDVYVTLYAKYGAFVFNNISRSESQHMSAVKLLLDRYGIADPAAGKAVGQFTDPKLQALYNQLIAQGSQSLAEAYKVGVAIENVDIADLKTHIAETSKADIQRVYNNLLFASQNHLRAFQRFQ
jgi:hypothetical protein